MLPSWRSSLPEHLFTLPEQHASRLRDEPHCQSFALSALIALCFCEPDIFVGHIPSVQDALIREVAGQALRSTRFDLLDKNRLVIPNSRPARTASFFRLTF